MKSILAAIAAGVMVAGCSAAPFDMRVDSRHFAQNCPASATSIAGGPPTPYSCLPGGRESGR